MNLDALFLLISGYERVGDGQIRLYVDGPVPRPSVNRRHGVQTPLYHLFAGQEAREIEEWLARNRVWQCMRVPTYTREKGVRAVLVVGDWNYGDGSALHEFARDRLIRDDRHRGRLRREVELVVGEVLGNPVRDGELADLHVLEDVVNAGPVGVELATTAEVVALYFGGDG